MPARYIIRGVDRTDAVESCSFSREDNRWHVSFKGNPTIFRYNNNNVVVREDRDDQASRTALQEEVRNLESLQGSVRAEITSLEPLVSRRFTGNGEDHDQFMQYAAAAAEKRGAAGRIRDLKSISDDPYFGRFDLDIETDAGAVEIWHLYIGERYHKWDDKLIIAWNEQDEKKRKIIQRFYDTDLSDFSMDGNTYQITCKRNITVRNGRIENVVHVFGGVGEQVRRIYEGVTDEFLLDVLRHYRGKPDMPPIIASLQKKQFGIISAPGDGTIIVQGCAGSGKTQILLHRLAYHKDQNSAQHVYIIAPNALFKRHARTLVAHLGLDRIRQLSIEELYFAALCTYDSAFKGRQNQIISNDFLPEEYLNDVCSDRCSKQLEGNISAYISAEIERAKAVATIKTYMRENRTAVPAEAGPAINELLRIIDKILEKDNSKEIQRQQAVVNALSDRYDAITGESSALVEQRQKIDKEIARCRDKQQRVSKYEERTNEISDQIRGNEQKWRERCGSVENKITQGYAQISSAQGMSAAGRMDLLKKQLQYEALYARLTEPDGIDRGKYEEQQAALNADLSAALKDFRKTFNTEALPTAYLDSLIKELMRLMDDRERLQKRIRECGTIGSKLAQSRELLKSLKAKSLDAASAREVREIRASLEKIGLSVCDQVIFAYFNSKKEQFGVKRFVTVQDGRGRTGRYSLLTRAELLYCLRTFLLLCGPAFSESYLLCIDEGQVLNVQDYQLLRSLFPKAVFNIFGDTRQNPYREAGIHDWSEIAGVFQFEKFELSENYRNTSQIVDYINKKCGSSMQAFGLDDGAVLSGAELHRPDIPADVIFIIRGEDQVKQLAGYLHCELQKINLLSNANAEPAADQYNVYPVNSVKGLEFESAAVLTVGMNDSEKYIACSRAQKTLYVIDFPEAES